MKKAWISICLLSLVALSGCSLRATLDDWQKTYEEHRKEAREERVLRENPAAREASDMSTLEAPWTVAEEDSQPAEK